MYGRPATAAPPSPGERPPPGAAPGSWAAVRGAVAACHPGPSLLATAVTVALAAVLQGSLPSPGLDASLVLVMLPAQLAIGAVNDLADLPADRDTRPEKPLVAGLVRPGLLVAIAVAGIITSLAAAALAGVWPLALTALGLGAGLGYDLGAKRTPASPLTWWAGFIALPLGAAALAGRLSGPLLWLVPLAGLLALALHCANTLPDLTGDRASGSRSLPVVLGERGSRAVGAVSSVVCGALIAALAAPLGQSLPVVAGAGAVLATVAVADLVVVRPARPFPPLALAIAVTATTWVAALPR